MAVGRVGMSVSDAYGMTLGELGLVIEAWQQTRTEELQASWEQTRFLALCSLMPYSKKRLKPTDLVMFDWEKGPSGRSASRTTREDVDRIMARFGSD